MGYHGWPCANEPVLYSHSAPTAGPFAIWLQNSVEAFCRKPIAGPHYPNFIAMPQDRLLQIAAICSSPTGEENSSGRA